MSDKAKKRNECSNKEAVELHRGNNNNISRQEQQLLKVLYDFQYETRQGQKVRISKDENLCLVERTNEDWWYASRPSSSSTVQEQAFYVPAAYVVLEPSATTAKQQTLLTSSKAADSENNMLKNRERKSSANSDECREEDLESTGSPEQTGKQEKRSHDSFRNVIRKLSNNLNPSSTKQAKSSSSSSKLFKKNSINSHDEVKPPKSKNDNATEASAFSKCFGRDMKNAVDRQTPFQEELEHALVNRSHRNIIYSSKVNDKVEQNKRTAEKTSLKHETKVQVDKATLSKLEKLSAKVSSSSSVSQEEGNSTQITGLRIKKVADDQQSVAADVISETQIVPAAVQESTPKKDRIEDAIKPGEAIMILAKADKAIKRRSYLNREQAGELAKKFQNLKGQVAAKESENDNRQTERVVKEEEGESNEDHVASLSLSILKDERKAWAVERLINELLGKSNKPVTQSESENEEKGASKLVEELYNMSTIEDNDTKEKINMKGKLEKQTHSPKPKACSVFDFSKTPSTVLPKTSVAKKSPKVLDEYNEANILNDHESSAKNAKQQNYEKPTYCNVSLNLRRNRLCENLVMEPRNDYREELLQLTPSLEKLANEIQFLPANKASSPGLSDEKFMSKFCSKSDSALNSELLIKTHQSTKFRSLNKSRQATFVTKSQVDIPTPSFGYSKGAMPILSSRQPVFRKHSFAISSAKISNKLEMKRKTRSLDDFSFPDDAVLYLDQKKPDNAVTATTSEELGKNKKPVPSLRSKDSFKKASKFFASGGGASPTINEQSPNPMKKPVPAKRRIIGALSKLENKEANKAVVPVPSQAKRNWNNNNNNNNNNADTIDIEKSTAIGFTRLLRAWDSGSEECLQNKNFPHLDNSRKSSLENVPRSMSNDDLSSGRDHSSFIHEMSTSLSDQLLLSSNDSSLDHLESGVNNSDTSAANSSAFFCEKDNSKACNSSSGSSSSLPIGWKQYYDQNAQQICFINSKGQKWFSSNDSEGKMYFFEENSNESYWALPPIDNNFCKWKNNNRQSAIYSDDYANPRIPEEENLEAATAAAAAVAAANWPQLFHGNMCILKEGPIDRTKITENGKKLKKSWSTSYAVLTELFLLFFKDAKTFSAMKMGQLSTAKPEISVDLNGVSIGLGDKFTSRKNVYIIGTLLGLQVIIQSENGAYAAEWYREIYDAVTRLPSGQNRGKVTADLEE